MPRLDLNASDAALGPAAEWLHGALATLPPPLLFRADLCLAEALANIVDHAGGSASAAAAVPVRLELTLGDAHVELSIRDRGVAFDPLAAGPAERPERLEDAAIGGLGLMMIRQYSDASRYRRDGDWNELTLRWQRSGPP